MENRILLEFEKATCYKLVNLFAFLVVIVVSVLDILRLLENGMEPVFYLHLGIILVMAGMWFWRFKIPISVHYSWIILLLALVDVSGTFRNETIFAGNSFFVVMIVCAGLYFSKQFLLLLTLLQALFGIVYGYWQTGLIFESTIHAIGLVSLAYVVVFINLQFRNSLIQALYDADVARESADKANEIKSQFLANMSHEMRTPLNGIMGLMQLLAHENLPNKERDYVNRAYQSSEHLLNIINNVLDYSKLEDASLKIEKIAFNLSEVLKFVEGVMAVQATAKHIGFKLDVKPECPTHLQGDKTRLVQVLLNLLGNAVKFTEQGQVQLRVSVQDKTARVSVQDKTASAQTGQVVLLFEVIDTGIGIPKQQQELIFSRFTQADHSYTRKYGGTGLGLTISNELVRLMGGILNVESETGQGSCFWFELPFHYTESSVLAKTEAEPATVESLPDMLVLVADDSESNRFIAVALLQKLGVTPITVDDGQQVIEAMNDTQRPFDLILMDMQMPVMDGLEATRQLRQQYGFTQIPIIALTANTQPQHLQSCLEAGMNDYMEKPISIDRLKAMLLKYTPVNG
jgi:signal transduction histidine kinase/ActR/RegA family two-component response regulator